MSATANLPEFITFTGVDEKTDVGRMVEMSSRWPIEWGVLLSRDRSGSDPRYPALDMGKRLVGRRLRLAAHLCGTWAAQVFCDDPDRDPAVVDAVGGLYTRIQLNVTDRELGVVARMAEVFGMPHVAEGEIKESVQRAAGSVSRLGALRAIVQCRSLEFPAAIEVDWLFDMSGGFGRLPEQWPDPTGREASWVGGPHRIGYAGGLGPDTVAEAVAAFSPAHVRSPFWIDMETSIRTEDVFDLDKCEAVCMKVYGESIEASLTATG